MAEEKTLIIIRPHVLRGRGSDGAMKIVEYYTRQGLTVLFRFGFTFSRKSLEEFYEEHKGKFFFENLMQTMSSGPCVVLILSGENAVERVRKINGPTDCRKAPPGTIRGDFGVKVAPEVKDPGSENAVHASDSAESADREIDLIFGAFRRKF